MVAIKKLKLTEIFLKEEKSKHETKQRKKGKP